MSDRDLSRLRVIGWPRSGTHHVADLFRIYFRMKQVGDEITRYYLPERVEPGTWGVYVYRDPRDILVSRFVQMYFRFEHTYQEILDGRTLAQTFREWFVEGKDPHVVPLGTDWRTFIYTWDGYQSRNGRFVTVRHENLVADRKGEFERILWTLGLPVIADRIDKTYEATLLTLRHPYSYRLYYWEGENEDLPAGLPGEWRRLMDVETAKLVQDYCGEWMLEKGYISNPWWWECLT